MNCVPIILARALINSSERNEPTTSLVSQTRNNDIQDESGSSPRSPRDCEASPHINGEKVARTLSVGFQIVPQQRVLISLTRLNAKLTENHTIASYPMLQYLDAYVCELNKFLTEQTLLLSAYMAVKLTEPPIPEELIQVCKNTT